MSRHGAQLPPPNAITLARHPTVDAPGRCYGRLDLPITPDAAAALAARLPDGPVWTSPAARCRDVARLLGRHHVEPRLQELDFGAWEGLAWEAIPRAALDAWAADPAGFAPPGGESGAQLVARVREVAGVLPPGAVVISHGGPLKVLRAVLRGQKVDLLAPAPPFGSVEAIIPTDL